MCKHFIFLEFFFVDFVPAFALN